MKNEIYIRKAQEKDVKAINDIVNDSINTSYSNWAWTERTYSQALDWFNEHDSEKLCVFVSEEDGIVTGYCSLSKLRAKEGYWPVVENSVYVHKDYRGKSIGKALLQKLIDVASINDVRAISAWIDSGNTVSIKMHEKFNFYITGELKNIGEKFGQRRSVTIMQLDLEPIMDDYEKAK